MNRFIAILCFMCAIVVSSCTSISSDNQLDQQTTVKSTRFINSVSELAIQYPMLELRLNQSSEFCTERDLDMAIRRQGLLYKRLTASRTVPYVGAEIENAVIMREAIPEDTVVVFYHKTLDGHCVWLLDKNGIREFESLKVSDAVAPLLLRLFYESEKIDAAQLLRQPLRKSAVAQSMSEANNETIQFEIRHEPILETMRRFLFPGNLSELISEYDRAVIVPYEQLGTFPFAAIPIGQNTYLFETTKIKIAPSLIDLVGREMWHVGNSSYEGYHRVSPRCSNVQDLPSTSSSVAEWTALIIGDPDYSEDPEFSMPQLEGAKKEAIDVARIFGAEALIGESATLPRVEASIGSANLLYFASHGISYSENGLQGFLASSGGARLTAATVQRMCLKRAQSAVLSACQTGLGQTVGGGTIGLARAFQIAGVNDVVMSLWNVDDEATRFLMTTFSRRIRSGDSAEGALQFAMTETRAVHPSPAKWASFLIFSSEF